MVDLKKFKKVDCNLCGQDNYDVIYSARPDLEKDFDLKRKFRSSADEMLIDQLVKCRRCGLIYINPRLKDSEILKGYSDAYDPLFVSQVKAREKTFTDKLKLIEKFYPKKGKILDIGTASASFLYSAKNRGWQVFGCEPSKWMVNWAKENYNIKVDQGDVFKQKYKKNSFDVITLWDVIEHTTDPSKVIEKCSDLLKDDGLFIVNYPDIGSFVSRLMGRKWLFLTSVHLYYFTPKTIRKMLSKKDFDVVLIRPHMQKLQIGYIMFRVSSYSKLLSKIGVKTLKFLKMQDLEIPYWFGQTFIIARKNKNLFNTS